jgi:hypothetical protein
MRMWTGYKLIKNRLTSSCEECTELSGYTEHLQFTEQLRGYWLFKDGLCSMELLDAVMKI